jgi:hypothetical protein
MPLVLGSFFAVRRIPQMRHPCKVIGRVEAPILQRRSISEAPRWGMAGDAALEIE